MEVTVGKFYKTMCGTIYIFGKDDHETHPYYGHPDPKTAKGYLRFTQEGYALNDCYEFMLRHETSLEEERNYLIRCLESEIEDLQARIDEYRAGDRDSDFCRWLP